MIFMKITPNVANRQRRRRAGPVRLDPRSCPALAAVRGRPSVTTGQVL
jgi:hypothetical protein